jgi:flagellar capping protein FliD
MATTVERIGIVETKVENLNEKIDDLKVDVKEMHDCLDKTRNDLTLKLDQMYNASCSQHAELAKELSSIKKDKDKAVWFVGGAIALLGWLSGHSDKVLSLFS